MTEFNNSNYSLENQLKDEPKLTNIELEELLEVLRRELKENSSEVVEDCKRILRFFKGNAPEIYPLMKEAKQYLNNASSKTSSNKRPSVVKFLINSYRKAFTVEITSILGCSVDCAYCPQDQLRKEGKGRKKIISCDDFEKAIDNIDIKTQIGWTGYSEPCLHPDLERMANYVALKGIPQYISTTLAGCEKSIDFVIRSKIFRSFTLHLPDNLGLMKGLKVDELYAQRLKTCLYQKLKDGLASTVSVTCFGDDLHPLIKDIVLNAHKSGCIGNRFSLLKLVNSRSGGLKEDTLKDIGFKVIKYDSTLKEGHYYCKIRKINSPVLIPDGTLNICSCNYGLDNLYGNLFQEKLSVLRKKWILNQSYDFSKGTLRPCTQCENYVAF